MLGPIFCGEPHRLHHNRRVAHPLRPRPRTHRAPTLGTIRRVASRATAPAAARNTASFRSLPPWCLLPPSPWQPQAHQTHTSPDYPASSWLLDSSASHHITSDMENLALHQPYPSAESVQIGNGLALPITHMGDSSLPTSSTLYLSEIFF